MLSKQQFEKKHAAKYAKLSPAEKAQRYQDYVGNTKSGSKKRGGKGKSKGNGNTGGNSINPRKQIEAIERTQIGSVPYRKKQPRNIPYGGGRKGSRNVRLSPCGANYISGLLNPFQYFDATGAGRNKGLGMDGKVPDKLPCVPNFPSVKSRKMAVFIRGSFPTQSNFVLAFAPRRAANNYGLDFALPPLIVSNGSSDPGQTFPLDLDVPGSPLSAPFTAFSFNTDYTVGSLSQYFAVRLVCAGCRIRYAGTTMNQSGIIHAVEEPNHITLANLTINNIASYESYFRCPVDKTFCSLYYNPVNPQEFEYDVDADFDVPPPGTVFINPMNHHYMGFIVQGLQVGSSMEYEAVAIMEVVGANVRDLTPSESDTKAMEVANNNLNPANQLQQNKDPKGLMNTIMSSGGDFTDTIEAGVGMASKVADISGMFASIM